MALTPDQAEQIRQKFLEQIEKLPAEQRGQLKEQIMNATPEQLESAMGGQGGSETDQCLFCGISNGSIETFKVYEDNSIIAFLDINPSAVGQTIIIPKEHYQFIFQIPDQVLWTMIKIIKMLEPLIVNASKAGGLSIYIGQGNAAGQYLKHLSVNLVPRYPEDKAAFYWPRNETAKEDLEKMAKSLKEGMDKMIREEKEKIEKAIKEKQKLEKKSEKEEKLPELSRRMP